MFLAIEFTKGRVYFSIFFVIMFIAFMIFSYKKDANNNQKHYRKSGWWVALTIVAVIGLLFLSKYLVKTYNM